MFSWPASEDECVDSASQCSTSKSGDGHEKTAERNWWEGEDCCSTEKGFAVQLLQQTMEAGYLKVPGCLPHNYLVTCESFRKSRDVKYEYDDI